jgi:7-alpha-hydroxysteroid dehydrogenase
VDILVNASRRCAISDPLDPEGDAVEMLWQQNVMTALRLSQVVARRMVQCADKAGVEAGTPIGCIINLSAMAATRSQKGLLGYSIASAAVEQMTRAMALELADKGIRVNAVSFGSVMSASLHGALKENPDWRGMIEDTTPMRRIAGPEELAETVQYLASDAARFVTGQVVCVDGGRGIVDAVPVPAF